MARPNKTGLEYFPLDVNIDDNLELIEAEHGLQGFSIVIKLWQKIYANGYYIEWSTDHALLFAKKINAELSIVNDVVNSCFYRKIFDETLFNDKKKSFQVVEFRKDICWLANNRGAKTTRLKINSIC